MTSSAEPNSPGFETLEAAIRAESAAARGLRAALQQKQAALLRCKLAGLQELAEDVISASQALSAAEAAGVAGIAALQAQGRLPAEPPAGQFSARLLIELAPPAAQPSLGTAVAELGAELALVSELNLQNDALLRNLLDYTKMAVRLLAGQAGADTYTRQGGVEASAARKLVDSRV